MTITRNDALRFALRTKQNFEFIENAAKSKASSAEPPYAVTQLTLSLLGIIVFPYEKLDPAIFNKPIAEIEWLGWTITLDEPFDKPKSKKNAVSQATGNRGKKTDTLDTLLWHLRNAAAHARLTFNSDSAIPEDVVICAEDKPGTGDVNWRAEIRANDLRTFCTGFLNFVDQMVG